MTHPLASRNVYLTGSLFALIGAITQLFEFVYAPYLFAIGALIIICFHFFDSWQIRKIKDKRLERLKRLGFLSSVLLVPAAYLMFTNNNLWVVAVLIYGVTTLFQSFRGN